MRVVMEGFKKLVSVEEALRLLEKLTRSLTSRRLEEVSLLDSLGRVCGEDILAPNDVPPYDRSAVDGYAVIAEDTFGASPTNPVELKVLGSVNLIDLENTFPEVKRGCSVEVMTGAPIPPGANAVVMAEDVRKIEENLIEVVKPVHPFQNISRRGEDFKKGEVVVEKGTLIKPWHIGALASLNITKVKVVVKPSVGVLSTGSELIEVGEEAGERYVVNSTKPMLKALIRSVGGEPVDFGIVEDDLQEIKDKIIKALEICDLLIITGGTSVGRRDLVPEAIRELGQIVVHGIAMRPGKPTGFGYVNGKIVFMFSGFPVASIVGFNLLAKPTIERMLGVKTQPKPTVKGILARKVASPGGVRCFVRVKVSWNIRENKYIVEPLMLTGSGLLSTLIKANGLLVIPENMEGYDEGEEVEVELFDPLIIESLSENYNEHR
ncbi:MAG: molybdopterin molybdotransferase MoeA [Nitrososphaerota archaeon]